MKDAQLILGNQLFPLTGQTRPRAQRVFMAESDELCTHFRYHQNKLVLFLSAMRHYCQELREKDYQVHYQALTPRGKSTRYRSQLRSYLKELQIERLHVWEIEDKFFEKEIRDLCQACGTELVIHPSPMFVGERADFAAYDEKAKRPFMKHFYEDRRRQTGLLMTKEGQPRGGKYSYDADNRKKLPDQVSLPPLPSVSLDEMTREVIDLVKVRFSHHPGDASTFWLPVTRRQALTWLHDFVRNRLHHFGAYEDAITDRGDFLFHAVLSPSLNLGHLLPGETVEKAIAAWEKDSSIPLNSIEGFVRQIIGWREFLRGIYQRYSERQDSENFFGHTAKFSPCWDECATGLPPLDEALERVERLGWTHHIERLMVLGNFMLLSQIHPQEVHRWFMERFVDSSDWVMGPNVYGMSQFSDGGIFATKPYICGSNYLRKMSHHGKGDWCDIADGLYWRFIQEHYEVFAGNQRMSMMVRSLDKMDREKKKRLFGAAEGFLERATC
ncbi:MAG: cryptochrome/photolyase family protein [Verrucomicrobiota bacterium]